MRLRNLCMTGVRNVGLAAALFSTVLNPITPFSLNAQSPKTTASPIQHVIIILGENRSFDHVFATYLPKNGETVSNLLSKHIGNAHGTTKPTNMHSGKDTLSDMTKFPMS